MDDLIDGHVPPVVGSDVRAPWGGLAVAEHNIDRGLDDIAAGEVIVLVVPVDRSQGSGWNQMVLRDGANDGVNQNLVIRLIGVEAGRRGDRSEKGRQGGGARD